MRHTSARLLAFGAPGLLAVGLASLLVAACGGAGAGEERTIVTAPARDLVLRASDLRQGYRVDSEHSGTLDPEEVAEWHLGYEPPTTVVQGFVDGHAAALDPPDEGAMTFYSEAFVFESLALAERLFTTAVQARSGGDYTERERPAAEIGEESAGYDYRPTLWGDVMLPEGYTAYQVIWRHRNVHGTLTGIGKTGAPEETLRLAQVQQQRMEDPANGVTLESEASDPPEGYRLRDLGTLGGDASWANDVNEQGQVVGASAIESGEGSDSDISVEQDVDAPDLAESVLAATRRTHAFLWQDGEMTDLGTLGGDVSLADDINNRGQVVGSSTTASGEEHAYLWDDGEMTDLGTLGGKVSTPWALNDGGQVVGSSTTADGAEHAFLWQDGAMTDLGTLGGGTSSAYGINDSGQVIGRSAIRGSDGMIGHAFLWQGGDLIDLGTLDGDCSAYDINDRGQVIGVGVARSGWHAFLWQKGTMTDLGTLGGDDSRTSAVNQSGQVVGYSDTRADESHAFLWENGTMIDLGTLGGEYSSAAAIDESGRVIGASRPAAEGPEWWQEKSQHAVLWEAGTIVDLGTLGGDWSGAAAIADGGTIAGNSATAAGDPHAVVWEPRR